MAVTTCPCASKFIPPHFFNNQRLNLMTYSSLRPTCAALALALLTVVAFAAPVAAQTDQADIGEPAPDFTLEAVGFPVRGL